jgi:hypothetical protein
MDWLASTFDAVSADGENEKTSLRVSRSYSERRASQSLWKLSLAMVPNADYSLMMQLPKDSADERRYRPVMAWPAPGAQRNPRSRELAMLGRVSRRPPSNGLLDEGPP